MCVLGAARHERAGLSAAAMPRRRSAVAVRSELARLLRSLSARLRSCVQHAHGRAARTDDRHIWGLDLSYVRCTYARSWYTVRARWLGLAVALSRLVSAHLSLSEHVSETRERQDAKAARVSARGSLAARAALRRDKRKAAKLKSELPYADYECGMRMCRNRGWRWPMHTHHTYTS